MATRSSQQDMCEILGYLQILGYQQRGLYSNADQRDDTGKRDFQILEIIAMCLATGKPGDVVAAAFEKRKDTTELVLAKNGHAGDSDRAAAKKLRDAIYDPLSNGAESLWPIIVERCRENIVKRISKLFDSLRGVRSVPLHLRSYHPISSTLDEELPRCGEYLAGRHGSQNPSVTDVNHVINRAWRDIMEYEESHPDLNSDNFQELAFSAYKSLSEASFILSRSKYLTWLRDTHKCDSDRIFKLQRRLAKVHQYYQGLETLLATRDLPPKEQISSVRWVTQQSPPSPTRISIQTKHWRDRITRHYGAVSEAADDALTTHFRKNTSFSFTPVVHAEVKLALSLEPEYHSSRGHSSPHTSDSEIRMIGCSKRSCLSCSLWLLKFNDNKPVTKYKWMTGGSHGKPYGNWMIPTIPMIQQTSQSSSNSLHDIAKALLKDLKTLLSRRLEHYTQEPLQSDEFASDTDNGVARSPKKDDKPAVDRT